MFKIPLKIYVFKHHNVVIVGDYAVYVSGKLSNRPGSEKKGLVWFHALCMSAFNSVNFETPAGKRNTEENL